MDRTTLTNAIKAVPKATTVVLREPRYAVIAIVTASMFLILAVYASFGRFVPEIIGSDLYDAGAKVKILIAGIGGFRTNLTLQGQVVAVALSVLTGVNVALFAYAAGRRRASGGAGIFGAGAVGLLGIGCASCGAALLPLVVGTAAATAVANTLPLRGTEFGIAGVVMTAIVTCVLSVRVTSPVVCNVRRPPPRGTRDTK